jgi:hypothetical protein
MLNLKTPDVTWIMDSLYVEKQESLQPVLEELKSLNYTIKDAFKEDKKGRSRNEYEKNGYYLWYASLDVPRYGKCGTCQEYISTGGIRTHNHTCEKCGAITYKEVIDGSYARFEFVEENDAMFTYKLQMKAYLWDSENLYLYPELDKEGRFLVYNQKDGEDYLSKHSDKWSYTELDGKTWIKIHYKRDWERDPEAVISMSEITSHYCNHSIVKLWDGKEYGEWDKVPVPESIIIYEAWHFTPLPRSAKLHERILSAAGMISDQGWYHQDGRREFLPVHFERMRIFVDRFTEIPVQEWDKTVRRFRVDGPGGIADIARFCYSKPDIANKPNIGNTLSALGKELEGKHLTEKEIYEAKRGLEDDAW